jgi:hypothetical protein
LTLFLQLLEWWYTSAEEKLAAEQKLAPPPPPPPPLPSPSGVPLPADPALCPLCQQVRFQTVRSPGFSFTWGMHAGGDGVAAEASEC